MPGVRKKSKGLFGSFRRRLVLVLAAVAVIVLILSMMEKSPSEPPETAVSAEDSGQRAGQATTGQPLPDSLNAGEDESFSGNTSAPSAQ